ncbi:hypothetical protein [Streptomyces canus]|nr:hypothetical protein [Streptomyces canus]
MRLRVVVYRPWLSRFAHAAQEPGRYGFDVTGVDYDQPAQTAILWPITTT